MKITQIQVKDKKYQVDSALYIKPSEINCRRFYELELCADFDIDASNNKFISCISRLSSASETDFTTARGTDRKYADFTDRTVGGRYP